MSKHTPGPWTAKEGIGGWQQFGSGGAAPVRVYDEANARLISASPDLLAVLEELQSLEDYCGRVPGAIADKIDAAIAKATGEE
jgi:hypothetical protein